MGCATSKVDAAESGKIPMRTVQVILLGDMGVGKTSLRGRFVGGEFEENVSPTIVVDFAFQEVVIDDEFFKIQLWDTSGQEQFHAIGQQFFRRATGVILVYDESRPQSFNALRDVWLPELKAQGCPATHLLIIGNKSDLLHDTPGISQAALADLASADKYSSSVARLSAKDTPTEDCRTVYQGFCENLLRSTFDLSRPPVDRTPASLPMRTATPPPASIRLAVESAPLPPLKTLEQLRAETKS